VNRFAHPTHARDPVVLDLSSVLISLPATTLAEEILAAPMDVSPPT
jgi:hypothetical protein